MTRKSNNPKDVLAEVILFLDMGKPSYALKELQRFKRTVEKTAIQKGKMSKPAEACDFCGEILEDYNKTQ